MIDTSIYKRALEEELAQLTKDLSDLGIHNPQVQEDWIATPEDAVVTEADENIAADRNESWIERRSTVATLETRYNNITRALQKIKMGTYGMCEICGEQIEEDRLRINPAARTDTAHITQEDTLPR